MSKIDVSKVLASVQKLYAKDAKSKLIITTGDTVKAEYTDKDVVPLRPGHPCKELLRLPGIPFNKIIEVAGKPDTGKSTWAGEAMASAQKSGIQVILWDSEDKFDAARFKNQFGGDPASILMIKTNETRRGGEMLRKFVTAVKEQSPDCRMLLVWDSVGGSQSRAHAEFELDTDKHAQPGQDAKENAMVMKALVALINKYPDSIAVYLANQTYAKIGFMQKGDAAAGGTKIEYHSSFIVFLKKVKTLIKRVKGVETKYGILAQATVTKNHLSHGETSVYKLTYEVTAAGARVLGDDFEGADEEEETDSDE